MEVSLVIWITIVFVSAICLFLLIKNWIIVYNKFIYWKNKVDEKFAGIDVIMQRRLDMLPALAQVAKKYSIHEYKTIKDTIEARSRWSKDSPINDKIKAFETVENNFIKLHAIFERYPKVKADKLYKRIMGSSNISRIERKLEKFRLTYNRAVRKYNERVERFPRNIVAKVHSFKIINYLSLGNQINQGSQEKYSSKKLFDD